MEICGFDDDSRILGKFHEIRDFTKNENNVLHNFQEKRHRKLKPFLKITVMFLNIINKDAGEKPLEKRSSEVVKKRSRAKTEKRAKLLEVFVKKKPKEREKLISIAEEDDKVEKMMPDKKKSELFSKLKLISKKR